MQIGRKWLWAFPFAFALTMLPFILGDSWSSSCACIPVIESFAHFSKVSKRSLFRDPEAELRVSQGLTEKFGIGTDRRKAVEDFQVRFRGAKCSEQGAAIQCDLFLESDATQGAERGYSVRFEASSDGKLTAVTAKQLYAARS